MFLPRIGIKNIACSTQMSCARFCESFVISVMHTISLEMTLTPFDLIDFQEAACLESHDPKIIFDLGLEYATQCQTSRALDCAKRFLGISTGAWVEGWRFSALLLTAQDRHSEAEVVLEAGLDASSPWQQGPLLRTRAKVEMAKGQSLRAIRTYQQLLTLIQAGHQRFSFEAGNWQRNMVCPMRLYPFNA